MPSNPVDNIKKLVGFIDVTPTWEEILPTLLTVYADGNATGRTAAREELERMARLADAYVKQQKAITDALNKGADELKRLNNAKG